VQNLDTNGSVTQLVTLPPLAIQLYKSLRSRHAAVGAAVKMLCQLLKKQHSSTNLGDAQPIVPDLDTHEDADEYEEGEEGGDNDGEDADVFGQGEYPGWYR
jgi:hypothetical protein